MNLDRKTFLKRVGMGAAGVLTASAVTGADADAAWPAWSEQNPEPFWAAIRAGYAVTRQLAYFNTGGLGPAAEPVLAAFEKTARRLQERSETGHGLLTGARATLARFLGAEPAEICFVRNATEGNAIIAAGLGLKSGDEVIFDSHAHPGGSFPWLNQQKLRGVKVRLFEPALTTPEENLARIVALIGPRTRVVQVSHMTAPTGIVLPVAAIAKVCRERGIWFHIDGAQTAGMFPFSLREIGCDSYATSGHKWLGAPHETGVFYIRRDRLEDVAPMLVGAYSSDQADIRSDLVFVPDVRRHEYGTRNAASVVALALAAEQQERIGRERIAVRGRAMAARVRAGLEKLSDVEILTPAHPGLCAAMITFRSPRVAHDKLFSRLLSEHKMRARPVTEENLNAVRVSLHLMNSPAECDGLVAGVAAILKKA